MGRNGWRLRRTMAVILLPSFLASCEKVEDLPETRVEEERETTQSRCGPADLPKALESGRWDPDFTVAGFTGHDGFMPQVMDVATDAEGRLLVAGRFQWVEGDRADPLMRLGGDGWERTRGAWERTIPGGGFSALAAGPAGEIALATFDRTTLGLFEHRYQGEIWLDRGSGSVAVIGSFEGAVRRMAWIGDELWVAGNFLLDGEGLVGLAIWNGEGWSAPPGGGADGPVYALLIEGERVWVGGNFSRIGGIDAKRVAEWDGSQWIAHDLELAYTVVLALAKNGDELYAGGGLVVDEDGEFGRRAGGIVHRTSEGWELLGGGLAMGYADGRINDLLVHEGAVYALGCFSHLGGGMLQPEAIPGRSIARWKDEAWEALDTDPRGVGTVWFDPALCGDEHPFAPWDGIFQRLHSHEGSIVLAGGFSGLGGIPSQGLTSFDVETETWKASTKSGLGLMGEAWDVAVGGKDCSLHAMGTFSHAGETPVPANLARFDGGKWSAIGTSLPPGVGGCSRVVIDQEDRVFLGCSTEPDDESMPMAKVLQWDGEEWKAIGEPHDLELLHDMALDPAGRLWIAGGTETGWVAHLEGDGFVKVEAGFDGFVFRLAFSRTKAKDATYHPMVVAGAFSRVGSVDAERIAHWDGASWHAMGSGLSTQALALAYIDDRIFVSTQYEGEDGYMILGEWDGKAWREIATPAKGIAAPFEGTVHTFTRLLDHDGLLFATGYVWPETGERNAFVYDGERFRPIQGGAAAISVNAVAVSPGGLWLGGTIANVGGGDGSIPSVGVARLGWEGAAP